MKRKVVMPASTKQREFYWAATCGKFGQVFFGGARGVAKTRTLAMVLVLRAITFPNTYHLILRRVRAAGELTLGREVQKVLGKLALKIGISAGLVHYSKELSRFTFPNGSLIQLGYCKTSDDWQQYQGGEWATIAWDEVCQFPEEAYDRVNASNRPGRFDITSVILCAGNPGGIGHEFVYRRMICASTRDRRTHCVLGRLADNPAMLDLDPGYALRVLRRLPKALRAQWEMGDWSVVEGAFFNVTPAFWERVDLPDWAAVYCGVDAGYWPSAFAVVWYAIWRDDTGRRRFHIIKSLKRYKLTAEAQAAEALAIEDTLPLPVRGRYADPQAWMRTERSGAEGGVNTANIWALNGWASSPAPRSPRADGWMLMRSMMMDGTLTADPDNCDAFRWELTSAMHDDRTDDIDPDCDDHCLDASRYLLNVMATARGRVSGSRPLKKRLKKTPTYLSTASSSTTAALRRCGL